MRNDFSQKDIVLVYYPFSNISDYKLRPAVIISNNNYNLNNEDVLLIGITSSDKSRNYTLDILNTDLVEGNLLLDSRIKVDHLLLAEKTIIQKKIAKISDSLFSKVKDKINELIS